MFTRRFIKVTGWESGKPIWIAADAVVSVFEETHGRLSATCVMTGRSEWIVSESAESVLLMLRDASRIAGDN